MQSDWLHKIQKGDDAATTQLWNEFVGQLLNLARRKLAKGNSKVADEEDVVLSAFNSFCKGAAENRFQKLQDRDDLWQILAMLTSRKATRQIERENAMKRGGGQVRGESVFGNESGPGIQIAATGGPSPEFQAASEEELERLLDLLPADELRDIVLAKLEGFTNDEIAESIGKHSRSVERKLRLIRTYWEEEFDNDFPG